MIDTPKKITFTFSQRSAGNWGIDVEPVNGDLKFWDTTLEPLVLEFGSRLSAAIAARDEDGSVQVSCQNCDWTGSEDATNEINDLEMRVSPGEIMPYGECPTCGSLCHERKSS